MDILKYIALIDQAINENESEIEGLDQAIGDGDHFINLKRGISAIHSMTDQLWTMSVNEQFKMIGMKVLSTVGGASGPLFATFFLEMGKHITDSKPSLQSIAEAFSKAVDGIKQRGKSDIGQKTMLDVLIPVAAKFQELTSSNMSTQEIASDINQFAIDCAHNTKDMLPTKGRSSGLGERALGHMDPGAKSCQVMISAVCQHIQGE